jgi:hypothetical protein
MEGSTFDTADLRTRIACLRDRAEHCRAMAGRALSDRIAEELASIAGSYEQDAAMLEQGGKLVA